MHFLSLIESKREGQPLAPADIHNLVREFTAGKIPDYQMAAMLMAVYFRGLEPAETRALTLAMRDSGRVLKLPKDPRPLVDKHSTGGIGDKVSLPLAPLLACLGFRVPMISGRGLGITGGTLDKLDSIPGFKTLLPMDDIVRQTQTVGCVICGQTDEIVPADKKIYALRDASGTVPSIPLIVASILSKKLAESLDALILDVKFGSAAFMQTKADAKKLADAMVALGNDCGVSTRAILTDMNTPLGRAAGNWLEVKESVACLEGFNALQIARPVHEPARPPDFTSRRTKILPLPEGEGRGEGERSSTKLRASNHNDLRHLVLTCAAHLLEQTRKAKNFKTGMKMAAECLDSGAPRKKFDEMLQSQGADIGAFDRKLSLDSTAPVVAELKSARAGVVSRCDARILGEVIRDLGGGRLTKESAINHDVGIDRMRKPGERVGKGAILARIHAATRPKAKAAVARAETAFEISA
ncbi:MAG TPA: thymidine phosphorylase [Verrucomicrobiae bacterium]|jgi:thymidine phosphorylase|nr:thymidine phosphorylase [Verrucomicrobiae bacterium]